MIACQDGCELRAVDSSDAQALFAVIRANQTHFARSEFIAPQFATVKELATVILVLMEMRERREGVNYGLWEMGQLIGWFTVNHADWHERVADVGYWLIESATGRGRALQALCSLRDMLTQQMGLNTLTAATAVNNLRSKTLLLRAGFQEVKLLPASINVNSRDVDEVLFTFTSRLGSRPD